MSGLETWISTWGYAAIFVVILLGNVGVPVPEESIILLSGYLAWRGDLSIALVIPVGILSASAGDNLGYWIGREGGRPILLKYGRYVFLSPHQIRRAEQFFARHGHRAVFFGRFIAGIRFLAGPLAGIARMPFGRFFVANVAGAAVYVTAVAFVGYGAGPHLHGALRAVRRAEHWAALLAVLLLAALAWRFAWRKKE
jgi:membrane protein DedA with SNARE-associated domain